MKTKQTGAAAPQKTEQKTTTTETTKESLEILAETLAPLQRALDSKQLLIAHAMILMLPEPTKAAGYAALERSYHPNGHSLIYQAMAYQYVKDSGLLTPMEELYQGKEVSKKKDIQQNPYG